MMKRILKSVVAVLRKTNHAKPAARPERPSPAPLLVVCSQVKAGEFSITKTTD
jgi:hypothetical protein